MAEPSDDNAGMIRQEQEMAKANLPSDRRTGGPGSGAVKGGEAAKPGEMDGDEDEAPRPNERQKAPPG